MTYLDLVNSVMRRLRETEASTWNENSYSTMVGDFVNDAMIHVQNAHNWSQLITEITITTTASDDTEVVETLGEHGQIWHVLNDTQNTKLRMMDRGTMKVQKSLSGNPSGPPTHYASYAQATDGDLEIQLYPTPDAVYTLLVLGKKHQARMTDDADVLLVPADPVIQFAYAYCLEERGDTGGSNNMTQMQRAMESLADAVGLDIQRDPTLGVWETI